MPLDLTTPVVKTGATWKIRNFHVYDAETGAAQSIRVELELQTASGEIVAQATGTLDWGAFLAELNAQTGTTINRLRKAVLVRAQAEGLLGAGSIT